MEQLNGENAVVPSWLLREVLEREDALKYQTDLSTGQVRVSDLPPQVAQSLLEYIAAQAPKEATLTSLPVPVKRSRCQAPVSASLKGEAEGAEPKTRRGLLGSVIRAFGVVTQERQEKETEEVPVRKRRRQRRYTKDQATLVATLKSILKPDEKTLSMLAFIGEQISLYK